MKLKLLIGTLKIKLYSIIEKNINIGIKPRSLTGLELYVENKAEINVGKNFYCRKNITLRAIEDGKIYIGNDVFMNDGVNITCMEGVSIGDNVRIGQNVLIYDHDHNYKDDEIIDKQGMSTEPVVIGDNVWIGSGVIILRGTKIESGSVIAAGTVVKGNIPKDSLVYNEKKMIIRNKK